MDLTWEVGCTKGSVPRATVLVLRRTENHQQKTFKVGLDFISRCSKADYLYNRRSGNTELKSCHCYGSGLGDI